MTVVPSCTSAPIVTSSRTRQRRDLGPVAKRPPKPPRLRGACNRCNSAKVKCNGDKSGCARCLAAGVECVFTNSLVGRVRGKRANVDNSNSSTNTKNIRRNIDINRDVEVDTGAEDDYLPHHTTIDPLLQLPSQAFPPSNITAGWIASKHSQNINPCTTAGSEEMNVTDLFTSTDTQSFGIMEQDLFWEDGANKELGVRSDVVDGEDDDQAPQSSSSELAFPSLEDNIFDNSTRLNIHPKRIQDHPANQYASNSPQTEISPSPTLQRSLQFPFGNFNGQLNTSTANTAFKKSPSDDAKYVILCAELVSTLESYIAAHLAVLDIILEISHAIVERLNSIINICPTPCSYRVLALLAVIMSQVIDLLEAGVSTLLAEDDPGENHEEFPPGHNLGVSRGPRSRGALLGLTFGAFQVDSKERRERKFRVVLRELGKTEKFLKMIMHLAGEYVDNSTDDSSPHPDKGRCFSDLDIRLKRLKEQVNLKRNYEHL